MRYCQFSTSWVEWPHGELLPLVILLSYAVINIVCVKTQVQRMKQASWAKWLHCAQKNGNKWSVMWSLALCGHGDILAMTKPSLRHQDWLSLRSVGKLCSLQWHGHKSHQQQEYHCVTSRVHKLVSYWIKSDADICGILGWLEMKGCI